VRGINKQKRERGRKNVSGEKKRKRKGNSSEHPLTAHAFSSPHMPSFPAYAFRFPLTFF
jgi:hypothetical protein